MTNGSNELSQEELNIINSMRLQKEIDAFFEMEPFGFLDDLKYLPEKKNHVFYTSQRGYGTYEEQYERLGNYHDQLVRELKLTLDKSDILITREDMLEYLISNNGSKKE